MIPESADLVLSLVHEFATDSSTKVEEAEVDYSICSVSNNGNYIPSTGSSGSVTSHDSICCDPLFELEEDTSGMKRCVSPVVSSAGPDVNVGAPVVCDFLPGLFD